MKSASQIIEALNKEKYFCECPCGCGEEIRLKDANLFYLNNFNAEGKKALMSLKDGLKQQRQEMKQRITSMQSKPKITAKAVNIGFILERIAPGFESFPYDQSDCRSLFDPIDYVIFEGLHKKGVVDRIIFSDIKTGNARLNPHQKEIKELVQKKKVDFEVY